MVVVVEVFLSENVLIKILNNSTAPDDAKAIKKPSASCIMSSGDNILFCIGNVSFISFVSILLLMSSLKKSLSFVFIDKRIGFIPQLPFIKLCCYIFLRTGKRSIALRLFCDNASVTRRLLARRCGRSGWSLHKISLREQSLASQG
jgi:hypothetical protein